MLSGFLKPEMTVELELVLQISRIHISVQISAIMIESDGGFLQILQTSTILVTHTKPQRLHLAPFSDNTNHFILLYYILICTNSGVVK
jgi:hypothetical protein